MNTIREVLRDYLPNDIISVVEYYYHTQYDRVLTELKEFLTMSSD